MSRKIVRKPLENAIVGKDWEEIRPCYKREDICSKIIMGVLSKYNPEISENDKNNDLKKLYFERGFVAVREVIHEMPVVVFNEAEVDYIFNIKNSYNPTLKRNQIKKAVKKLRTEDITIPNQYGGINCHGIFPNLSYRPDDKKETLIAEFNYALLPFVLDLKNKSYTLVSLTDIKELSSDYAIKLYNFCMKYDRYRKDFDNYIIETNKDYLYKLLNITEGYNTTSFHRKILAKYTEEISEKTNYRIQYKTNGGRGKLTTKYTFIVNKKEQPYRRYYEVPFAANEKIDLTNVPEKYCEDVIYLVSKDVNRKLIWDIIAVAGYEYLHALIKKVDESHEKKLQSDNTVKYGAYFGKAWKAKWLDVNDYSTKNTSIDDEIKEPKAEEKTAEEKTIENTGNTDNEAKIKECLKTLEKLGYNTKNVVNKQEDIDLMNDLLDNKAEVDRFDFSGCIFDYLNAKNIYKFDVANFPAEADGTIRRFNSLVEQYNFKNIEEMFKFWKENQLKINL